MNLKTAQSEKITRASRQEARKKMNEQLKQWDEMWSQTPAAENKGTDEVPDGKYVVTIERCCFAETKNTGKPHINWGLVVAEGDFKGRWIWKKSMLSQENLSYLKKDLQAIGALPEKLSDFKPELLIGERIAITTKKKGEFVNVYFNGAVEEELF